MSIKAFLLPFVLLLLTFTLTAQETWSLEKCIDYAQQNNLNIDQARLTIRQAELDEKQARWARLPNVTAGTTFRYSLGRTIDFTTNEFTQNNVFNNSGSIDASLPVFTGGRLHKQIEQGEINLAASRADAEEIANNIYLSIANTYLTIMLAEEQLANARERRNLSQRQLEQTDRFIEAGTLPRADRLDILAQVARDEQQMIIQQNNIDINYLNLKQLLNLPDETEIQVEKPDLDLEQLVDSEVPGLRSIYTQALQTQPQIQAANLRILAAEKGKEIARTNYLPTITLFGNLNTYFSDQAKDFMDPNTDNTRLVYSPPIPSRIDGMDAIISLSQLEGTTFPKAPYFQQLSDNFGQGIGVNLSVPIFTRGQNAIGVERADLGIINAQNQDRIVRQQLQADIQRALTDVRAGRLSYEAAQRTVEALEIAYSNAERRYELGAVNTFDLTLAKSNYDQAVIDQLVAKYDYIFRVKVLEFYQGKKISLD